MYQYMTRLLFSACILCIAGQASSTPIYWDPATGGNGHYYDLIDTGAPITWHQAKADAGGSTYLGLTGHLVTVTSAVEDDFLRANFESLIGDPELGKPGLWAWIGLTDASSIGSFQWITGEPFSYSNWYSGEPNFIGYEHYGMYWTRGDVWSWNNLPDSYPFATAYFVEFQSPIPEPETYAMLLAGLSLFGFTLRRRKENAM